MPTPPDLAHQSVTRSNSMQSMLLADMQGDVYRFCAKNGVLSINPDSPQMPTPPSSPLYSTFKICFFLTSLFSPSTTLLQRYRESNFLVFNILWSRFSRGSKLRFSSRFRDFFNGTNSDCALPCGVFLDELTWLG